MSMYQDGNRTPLLDDAGRALLARMREHPDAPRWTYAVGDRLVAADLDALDHFRAALTTGRATRDHAVPPSVLAAIARARETVPRLRDLPSGDLAARWEELPTSTRAELAAAPWEWVPTDTSLTHLLVYRTAGTTGHPVEVPHHPLAVASYLPLVEAALAAHGVVLPHAPDAVSCLLVSAQLKTYTYATVLSGWGGAGFSKINLRPTDWPSTGACTRWMSAWDAPLVNGEPVAFAELLAMDAPIRPRAMLSTSNALTPGLVAEVRERLGAALIDWYSTVETGPIAYACPRGDLHVLPHDVHVEVVDPDSRAVPPGARGEIVVSGGRNPFLPLLRYRTGDTARLVTAACACGDPAPRLLDLEGRTPVVFRARDGTPVGPVDVSRRLRELPLLLHRLRQRPNGALTLCARALPDRAVDPAALVNALGELFGDLPIEVTLDGTLGDDGIKVVPYALDP